MIDNINFEMKTFNIILLFFAISFNGFSQEDNIFNLLSQTSEGGKVYVFQNARIQTVFNDYVKGKKDEQGCQGYRVQIYFGSGHHSKESAYDIRNAFVSKYQDIPVHIVFQEPYYKVRVGDFRNKSEAMKVLKMIELDYDGAFIVKDYIKFPEL